MGNLKNYEKAYVSLEKLTGYCLNEYHPYGKEKATTFKSVLGLHIAIFSRKVAKTAK